MNAHGMPSYMHRPATNKMSVRGRQAVALANTDRNQPPKVVSLKKAPWDKSVRKDGKGS